MKIINIRGDDNTEPAIPRINLWNFCIISKVWLLSHPASCPELQFALKSADFNVLLEVTLLLYTIASFTVHQYIYLPVKFCDFHFSLFAVRLLFRLYRDDIGDYAAAANFTNISS